MCALHLSVTYNVMSDVLAGFQTETSPVSEKKLHGDLAGRTVKWRTFTGPKPPNDLRDGRNFGIFHPVNLSPSLCSSHVIQYTVPLLPPFPPDVNRLAASEDLFSLMYFYQAKVHWRQQRYQPELFHLGFSLEALFFFAQMTEALLTFLKRVKQGEIIYLVSSTRRGIRMI